MLSPSVRILNFDDSLTQQKKVLAKFHPAIINLTKIGPSCRHRLNKKTAQEFKNVLTPDLKNSITFLGSGDFHHISSLLIEQFLEPLSVIIFDYHPDWDILPPKLGCGSWVSRILERQNIVKVILIGVSSNDISSFWIHTGNLNSLTSDRLEIYPYIHKPTIAIFKKVPDNISIKVTRRLFYNQIYWQALKNKNLNDFILEIIGRLKDNRQVYVSIDKDCLKSNYALTNWEEGHLELDEMLLMLRLIKGRLDIVGLDIAGDYSQPLVRDMIKKICLALDHPKDYTAKGKSRALINSLNEQTNIKILESLKD